MEDTLALRGQVYSVDMTIDVSAIFGRDAADITVELSIGLRLVGLVVPVLVLLSFEGL